jgi:hypothetical protein
VYNKVGHGDFVVEWPTAPPPMDDSDDDEDDGGRGGVGRSALLRALPAYARDLAGVVSGDVAVDYVGGGGGGGGGAAAPARPPAAGVGLVDAAAARGRDGA